MNRKTSRKKEKVLKTKVLEYITLFEPQEEGGFVVTVPDLPGCVTQGETFEETLKNAKEAITLYLETVGESEPGREELYLPSQSFATPVRVNLKI